MRNFREALGWYIYLSPKMSNTILNFTILGGPILIQYVYFLIYNIVYFQKSPFSFSIKSYCVCGYICGHYSIGLCSRYKFIGACDPPIVTKIIGGVATIAINIPRKCMPTCILFPDAMDAPWVAIIVTLNFTANVLLCCKDLFIPRDGP